MEISLHWKHYCRTFFSCLSASVEKKKQQQNNNNQKQQQQNQVLFIAAYIIKKMADT
jgi:hypothetical protein